MLLCFAVEIWGFQLPLPLILALMATLGYLFGRQRPPKVDTANGQARRELRRAKSVARELERIALGVRKNLSRHHASLNKFRERVNRLASVDQQEAAWQDLCREAEEVLRPTLRLAAQIASAYDQIRQQSSQLMSFTELRTDPLTGVSNRRAMDDALSAQFALMTRYHLRFSLALFDIDHFKQVNDQHGHLHGDRMLQEVARLIDDSVRETDLVARFGGEEFMVIMPQTDLVGASIFAERLRAKIGREASVTVSGGVATAIDGDSPQTLMARADAALYRAKTSGRNRVCRHSGLEIEAVAAEHSPPPVVDVEESCPAGVCNFSQDQGVSS